MLPSAAGGRGDALKAIQTRDVIEGFENLTLSEADDFLLLNDITSDMILDGVRGMVISFYQVIVYQPRSLPPDLSHLTVVDNGLT